MLFFKFCALLCTVVMLLVVAIDYLFIFAARLTGGIGIWWRSPAVLLIPLTLLWLAALAITCHLAARWHIRPF